MKTPRLNLSGANRPGMAAGLIVLALATLVLLATMQYLDALKHEGEALDDRESAIAAREHRFEVISKANRNPASPQIEALMAQQRFATEPARDLIERGWQPNIAFLTLEVVTASRQINLTFETRTAQEALSYADWFEAQPATESVSVKRQTEKPGPPIRSVETTLQVIWRPFAGGLSTKQPPAASPPAASSREAP